MLSARHIGAHRSPTTVSVLVPTWRRPESLARCLDALEGQVRTPDEVVLVVRDDDDQTRDMLARRSSSSLPIRIVAPDREGVIAALNCGFDQANGDLIAVTDDDTVPNPDWLQCIFRRFAGNPDLGALSGRDRVVAEDGYLEATSEPVVGRIRWYGRVIGNHHLGSGPMRDIDILKGANMALRRAAITHLRIDPALRGKGAEPHWEIDLSLALKATGWRLAYDPAIGVDHYAEARHVGQREDAMSPHERFDAVHNQAYALLKGLSPVRRLTAFAYGVLVGTRADPGPLLFPMLVASGQSPHDALGRTRVATTARIEAFRSWGRGRRSGRSQASGSRAPAR